MFTWDRSIRCSVAKVPPIPYSSNANQTLTLWLISANSTARVPPISRSSSVNPSTVLSPGFKLNISGPVLFPVRKWP